MHYTEILNSILHAYKQILHDNLVGLYIHGSIGFGCFNWDKSDIDFLVVTKESPSQNQKEALIKVLLKLENVSPPKGLEMSLVLEKYCVDFVYPTPFELHFSNMHIERCKNNLTEYCHFMSGTDKDLAAHFIVIKNVGIALYGKEIKEVFRDIPLAYYLDSIKSDIEDAEDDIVENPIYIVLNLCRVLAYIKSNCVISKEQGGLWGIEKLPTKYAPLIQAALQCYRSNENMSIDNEVAQEFCQYMLNEIC